MRTDRAVVITGVAGGMGKLAVERQQIKLCALPR